MVVFLMRDVGQRIHEREGAVVVLELVGLLDRGALVDQFPAGQLLQ
jgi:hypothetical protein